jgi:DNA end-binding protein Ku
MAESYISALSGDFEPGEFSDDYREALEEVINDKVAGREVKAPAEEPESTGQVVDLMEALRRSVAEAKAKRGEDSGDGAGAAKKSAAGKAKKGASKKTAAKKSATKKSASSKKSAAKKSAARRSA